MQPSAAITSFSGPYRFLSNFAETPFSYAGVRWPTAEHCYQAGKSPAQGGWIAEAPTPGEAKRRGRAIIARPDWDQVKRRVMLQVVLAKFCDPDLAQLLAATGGADLVEGNHWGDEFWGAVHPDTLLKRPQPIPQLPVWGLGTEQPYIGRNWLGRILMMVRDVMAPEMR